MAAEAHNRDPAEARPDLPEKIGPADLEALNQALAGLFQELRFARSLPPGETHGRLNAAVALGAAWRFFIRFEPALREQLHVPLMDLHGALLALNDGTVERVLKPTVPAAGGRKPDSPRQQKLVGYAVGAVGRLRWTGISPGEAR